MSTEDKCSSTVNCNSNSVTIRKSDSNIHRSLLTPALCLFLVSIVVCINNLSLREHAWLGVTDVDPLLTVECNVNITCSRVNVYLWSYTYHWNRVALSICYNNRLAVLIDSPIEDTVDCSGSHYTCKILLILRIYSELRAVRESDLVSTVSLCSARLNSHESVYLSLKSCDLTFKQSLKGLELAVKTCLKVFQSLIEVSDVTLHLVDSVIESRIIVARCKNRTCKCCKDHRSSNSFLKKLSDLHN